MKIFLRKKASHQTKGPGFRTPVLVACFAFSAMGALHFTHNTGLLVASAVAAPTPKVSIDAVVSGYGQLVYATYADNVFSAQLMQKSINKLLESPSQANLIAARQSWLKARDIYGQTEVFRFYGGPIDNENGPEGQINAWPMDESYVDYVQGAPDSGLIQDAGFDITRDSLIRMNERGGEENVATGWHAIEFLLWGQDLNEEGAGQRPYTDFVSQPGDSGSAERRRVYLQTVTDLLVDDLKILEAAWLPSSKVNYRAEFEKGGRESLRKILIGMGSLSRGELAGERMEVALFSYDQEDEHSCFSDNTHKDIVANALGIANVWNGQYRRSDGTLLQVPSLEQLVSNSNAELAEQTGRQLNGTVELSKGIQAPFDHEINGGADGKGRERIQKTVASLVKQSELIVASANAIGLSKLTLVQP